ncbi:hypothetical protein BH24BAC1_BH24BAC1_00750 [soil metagenome]
MPISRKYKLSSLFLVLTLTFCQPVFAKASKPSKGKPQTGMASWYGIKFQGRSTSSGEPYNRHKLTAAHKTLPLQTLVKVTNLETDQSVIVRINDRGPFVGQRIIDLSEAAAKEIGYRQQGLTKVKVEVIQYPPAKNGERTVARAAFSRVPAKKKSPSYSFAFKNPEVSRLEARDYLMRLPGRFYELQNLPPAALNSNPVVLLLESLPQYYDTGNLTLLQDDSGWYAALGEAALSRQKPLQKGVFRILGQVLTLES